MNILGAGQSTRVRMSDTSLGAVVDETGRRCIEVAYTPDSWWVVRVPHYGVDLAYRDADRPTGITRPAVYAETIEATAAATRGLQQLSDGARKWVRLHEGAMS